MNSVYFSFKVDAREKIGKKFRVDLKSSSKVPGIIYGNDFLQPISIDITDLNLLVTKMHNGINLFECNFNDENF
ncbi:MAG TPA: hypothetical protein ACYCC8_01265 [Candidatus Azoamicus sp.]